MYLHKRHSHVYIRHAAHGLHGCMIVGSGRMCVCVYASPNKHGIGNVRVQMRNARRKKEEEKEKWEKREKG